MVKRGKEVVPPTEGGASEEVDDSPSKKAKLAKLAADEWERPALVQVEKGGHQATCKEYKQWIKKAGGTAAGYKPLATRIGDTEKPLHKFSWPYQRFMAALVAVRVENC
jgi:hypothetical protein